MDFHSLRSPLLRYIHFFEFRFSKRKIPYPKTELKRLSRKIMRQPITFVITFQTHRARDCRAFISRIIPILLPFDGVTPFYDQPNDNTCQTMRWRVSTDARKHRSTKSFFPLSLQVLDNGHRIMIHVTIRDIILRGIVFDVFQSGLSSPNGQTYPTPRRKGCFFQVSRNFLRWLTCLLTLDNFNFVAAARFPRRQALHTDELLERTSPFDGIFKCVKTNFLRVRS